MKITVVGATGLVGGIMLDELAQRGFAQHTIIAAASPRSASRQIPFAGRMLTVVTPEEALAQQPRYALFSAGAAASRTYAPAFAQAGCTVIDNSSCWRMQHDIPLVVPEINIDAVRPDSRIIANPNCSTIQMVLALSRLHWHYRIRRIVVATYQSITGTGQQAVQQLFDEERYFADHDTPADTLADTMRLHAPHYNPAYPHQIFRNLFPHGGAFNPDGYTSEEQKLVDETRKILGDPSIQVSATVVRVPVVGGHSEAVNVEFHNEYELPHVRRILADTPGVLLVDDPQNDRYPMPIDAHNRPEVLVGRLRRDPSQPRTLNLWCTADNLRKGAATNAVQILQHLTQQQ